MFNAISACFFSMAILHLMANLQGGTALTLVIALPIALVLATLVFLIFQFKASGILFGLTYLVLVLPNMNEGTSVINLILIGVGMTITYFRNNSHSLFYASNLSLNSPYKLASKMELKIHSIKFKKNKFKKPNKNEFLLEDMSLNTNILNTNPHDIKIRLDHDIIYSSVLNKESGIIVSDPSYF